MLAMKCLMYALECKKILGVAKVLFTAVTVLVLGCTAAKMFLFKSADLKKMGKALKKVIK